MKKSGDETSSRRRIARRVLLLPVVLQQSDATGRQFAPIQLQTLEIGVGAVRFFQLMAEPTDVRTAGRALLRRAHLRTLGRSDGSETNQSGDWQNVPLQHGYPPEASERRRP